MFLVGLTGGIASGKSTCSNFFRGERIPVVDADIVAREVVEPGRRALKKIVATFGPEVLHSDGTLNREKLGGLVFSDEAKRKQLNMIMHPEIGKAMMWKLLWLFLSGHQFVVMDLPLLFESKTYLPYMSYILVVSCSSEKQLERLITRNNYTTEEAENRIKAQMTLAEKCLLATTVLDNNGTIEELQRQLHQICIDLRRSKRHWKLRLGLLSLFLAPLSILTYFLLSTN